MQLQKARKLNIKEEDYYKIIISKTAALLSACTACGARSVSEEPEDDPVNEGLWREYRNCFPDTEMISLIMKGPE